MNLLWMLSVKSYICNFMVVFNIRKGFSLLELSIVLMIIAVVMGGIMLLFNESLDKRQQKETEEKLAVIEKTLRDYRLAFNRIPCPSDITQDMDATSNNYYGVEAANMGVCSGGTPSSNFTIAASSFTGNVTNASTIVTAVSSTSGLAIGTIVSGTGIDSGTYVASIDSATQITLSKEATATNAGVTISYNTIAAGMVPTKTLQLPDDYAIDGWGRRIMYAVDVNLTATSGFTNVPVTDSSTNRITVNNAAATAKTNSAVYLLLSYGKNGHGSYPRSGGSSRLANYGSADSDELVNCHCNSTAAATAFSSTFVQKPSFLGGFDDIVLYKTRADLKASYE